MPADSTVHPPALPPACQPGRMFPAKKSMERRLYIYTFEFLFYGVFIMT